MVHKSEQTFEDTPEDVESDIVVRIPPIKEQIVRVKIKSVKKATPHIVKPEGV